MQRVFPSITDEEALQDSVDMQLTNQEGTTDEVVNEAGEWSLEAVVEGADDNDNDHLDKVELVA